MIDDAERQSATHPDDAGGSGKLAARKPMVDPVFLNILTNPSLFRSIAEVIVRKRLRNSVIMFMAHFVHLFLSETAC